MGEATPHANDANVDVDRIFDVLASKRRRIVLRHLLMQRQIMFEQLLAKIPPLTIEELADGVTRVESTDPVRPERRRNRIATSLRHNHLPKMARSDLIDFDTERGLITAREAAYAVEPYLELAQAAERHDQR